MYVCTVRLRGVGGWWKKCPWLLEKAPLSASCVCVWVSDQADCLRKIAVIWARWQASHLSPDPPLAFPFAPITAIKPRGEHCTKPRKSLLGAKWNTCVCLSACSVCGLPAAICFLFLNIKEKRIRHFPSYAFSISFSRVEWDSKSCPSNKHYLIWGSRGWTNWSRGCNGKALQSGQEINMFLPRVLSCFLWLRPRSLLPALITCHQQFPFWASK